jgi:hypothetical protein
MLISVHIANYVSIKIMLRHKCNVTLLCRLSLSTERRDSKIKHAFLKAKKHTPTRDSLNIPYGNKSISFCGKQEESNEKSEFIRKSKSGLRHKTGS